MAITLKTIKKAVTELVCVPHKPKWVGQGWIRINSKQFQVQTRFVCTKCGQETFKPIGE